jgi:hypothetical protein
VKLPALAAILALALTACGSSHTSAPSTSQAAPAAGSTVSPTTAPTTSSSAAAASSTSSGHTTTEPAAVDPATPATSLLDHPPSTLPGAMTIPVASSAEDEAIFAGYRAFLDAYYRATAEPTGTWNDLRASTLADTFEVLSRDLHSHFAAGEVGNIEGGWTPHPTVAHRYEIDFVGVADCLVDNTFWMDSSTRVRSSQGTSPQTSNLDIDLIKQGGVWRVSGIRTVDVPCGS